MDQKIDIKALQLSVSLLACVFCMGSLHVWAHPSLMPLWYMLLPCLFYTAFAFLLNVSEFVVSKNDASDTLKELEIPVHIVFEEEGAAQ